MKTVKNGSDIRRVKDEVAATMVKNGWKYCSKSEFKATGQKAPVQEQEVKAVKKDKKKKDRKPREEAIQEVK